MMKPIAAVLLLVACNSGEPEGGAAPTGGPADPAPAPGAAAPAADDKPAEAPFDPKRAPVGFIGCPDGTTPKEGPDGTYRWCEKDGKRHGPEMAFDSASPTAQAKLLRTYVDGVEEGKAYVWDRDGDLQKEIEFAAGRAAGVWTEYKKGVLHGTRTYFTPEGTIDRAEVYRDGENVTVPDPVCPDGTKLDFQRNLDLSYPDRIGDTEITVDLRGYSRRWCLRRDGKPHGPYAYYGRNMVIQQTGTFVAGVEDGKRTTYSDTGELTGEGMVKKGRKTGTWTTWRSGKKYFEEVFDAKGNKVEHINYDDAGNPVPKKH